MKIVKKIALLWGVFLLMLNGASFAFAEVGVNVTGKLRGISGEELYLVFAWTGSPTKPKATLSCTDGGTFEAGSLTEYKNGVWVATYKEIYHTIDVGGHSNTCTLTVEQPDGTKAIGVGTLHWSKKGSGHDSGIESVNYPVH